MHNVLCCKSGISEGERMMEGCQFLASADLCGHNFFAENSKYKTCLKITWSVKMSRHCVGLVWESHALGYGILVKYVELLSVCVCIEIAVRAHIL